MDKKACLKCKHQWYPRKPGMIRRCPRCASLKWDGSPDKRANNHGAKKRTRATKWGFEKLKIGQLLLIPHSHDARDNDGYNALTLMGDQIFRSMHNYNSRSKRVLVARDQAEGNNFIIERVK